MKEELNIWLDRLPFNTSARRRARVGGKKLKSNWLPDNQHMPPKPPLKSCEHFGRHRLEPRL
jgi:hypothetical protein